MTSNSTDLSKLVRGVGVGASLMFFFDPRLGRRRRALMRDQLLHLWKIGGLALTKASRDFNHRLSGVSRKLSVRFDHCTPTDQVLVEQIRSKLGRIVRRPHSIFVESADGHITLSGAVLNLEFDSALACIARVNGVRSIETRLQIYPGGPSLGRTTNTQATLTKLITAPKAISAVVAGGLTSGFLFGLIRKNFLSSAACATALVLFARGMDFDERRTRRLARDRGISKTKSPQINMMDQLTLTRMTAHH